MDFLWHCCVRVGVCVCVHGEDSHINRNTNSRTTNSSEARGLKLISTQVTWEMQSLAFLPRLTAHVGSVLELKVASVWRLNVQIAMQITKCALVDIRLRLAVFEPAEPVKCMNPSL